MEDTQFTQERESIKVFKNTKGYNWEFRIVRDKGETEDDFIKRSKRIDDKLKENYGGDL
jgi:hypothetical protein